jgi:hypothetical protein
MDQADDGTRRISAAVRELADAFQCQHLRLSAVAVETRHPKQPQAFETSSGTVYVEWRPRMTAFVYDVIGAYNAGETRHPQVVIRELFPDAHSFEPNTIADVWTFRAGDSPLLPPFVRRA